MRTKGLSLALGAVLLFGALAVPASANKVPSKFGSGVPLKDVGLVLQAMAKVGKNRDGCLNDGNSNVFGPGLGLPVNGTKNAYYQITGAATSLANGHVGEIKLCGRLTKEFSAVGGGLGASCLDMKGWDGKGRISMPGKPHIFVDKFGWKVTLLGTFVFQGQAVAAADVGTAKAKKAGANDVFFGVVNGFGGRQPACFTKAGAGAGKTGGAQAFVIDMVYAIDNGDYDAINPNGMPLTCKAGLAAGCLYDPKKVGKNG